MTPNLKDMRICSSLMARKDGTPTSYHRARMRLSRSTQCSTEGVKIKEKYSQALYNLSTGIVNLEIIRIKEASLVEM